MRKIPLGRTGIEVSEICLGSMTWGTQNTEAEAHAQLDRAIERGVNFIDTAEMYPTNPISAETVGGTERIIGNWLKATGRRDRVVIATKVSGEGTKVIEGGPPISRARMTEAVENSLRRLQTDVIDLYQLHWPNRGSYHFRQNWSFDPSHQRRDETVAHMMEILETAHELVQAGKIRHLGLSNESAWGTAMWLRLAEENDLPRMQTIQNEYSLLCRLFDTDLAELSVNEELPLLGYSPLAAGLLSGKYAGDVTPEGTRRALNANLGGRITPRVWSAVSAYMGIANEAGLDPCQMAIAWYRSRPFTAIPIIGATSTEQLDNLLGAADLTLSDDVLAAIGRAWRAHPMPF
ncbi:aldo/keto reductase [Alkalilacustris brevis]|uniref:aldo/keto reductase n=1 Tax=Alkalilacustris brevis TaxID=2026338 RepID=UPI000E0DFB92|nr:aldo/keto reductase [Alkalilacustris brevis]